MYLIDTNVFLEILLGQEKSEVAKRFLSSHVEDLAMSDFTLHSIGVILFRLKRPGLFLEFINDALLNIEVLTPPRPKGEGFQKKNVIFLDSGDCR